MGESPKTRKRLNVIEKDRRLSYWTIHVGVLLSIYALVTGEIGFGGYHASGALGRFAAGILLFSCLMAYRVLNREK